MANPFLTGNPIQSPQPFINRTKELRKLVGRINSKQSSIIVGEPRSGKTSLLYYLMHDNLYESGTNNIFSYVDIHIINGRNIQIDFWEYALQPIRPIIDQKNQQLKTAYHNCQREKFSNFSLERLFIKLNETGYKLVLLLDEFDMLLEYEITNPIEFFGGLRSMATRYPGLKLVIATRQPVAILNKKALEHHRSGTGSPFFNFLEEIPLQPFSERAVADLLSLGKEYFVTSDRQFIMRVAGGHPYFLQTIASELWYAYEDRDLLSIVQRHSYAAQKLYECTRTTMQDIWRLWPPEQKKAFAIVALDQMPRLLGTKEFAISQLLEQLNTYKPELHELAQRGFIKSDPTLKGGWQVTAEALLWFMADELIKALRSGDELGEYLRKEEWDGYFTKGEKKQFTEAVTFISNVVKDGVTVFIKAAAEGMGKAVSG